MITLLLTIFALNSNADQLVITSMNQETVYILNLDSGASFEMPLSSFKKSCRSRTTFNRIRAGGRIAPAISEIILEWNGNENSPTHIFQPTEMDENLLADWSKGSTDG